MIEDEAMTASRLAAEVGALLGDQARLAAMAVASAGAGQARRGLGDRQRGAGGRRVRGARSHRAGQLGVMNASERSATDWAGRRLHFIGIGGAGMSGLALVCARLGAAVTGSDRADSSYMERLRRAGLEPAVGHDAANLPRGCRGRRLDRDRRRRTRSSPWPASAARPFSPAARLLAELCAEKRLLAVAGTHGKTTTSAMAAWALRATGADPAFFVGGEVPGLGEDGDAANAGWGEGEWVVAEADESDGSFLELKPEVAVITNVEMDHHSHWGSIAELRAAFDRFSAGARVAEFDAARPAPPSWRWRSPATTTCSTPGRRSPALAEAGADLEQAAARARRLPGGPPPPRAEGRGAAAPPSTTTTPTTRPSCAPRSRRCGSSAASA